MKRKIIHIMLFSIFVIVFSTSVLGAVFTYDVDYKCSNDVCIEGDMVTFDVTLKSDSFQLEDMTIDSITYNRITLKDKQYESIIAMYSDSFTMTSYDTKTIKLTGRIPPPTKGHDLYYVPCFDRTIAYHWYGDYTYKRYDKKETTSNCGQDTLTMKVYPLSEIECRNTGNCQEDEECLDFKCKKLICEDYQGYKDHQCVDLACTLIQTPKNHECQINYYALTLAIIIFLLLLTVGAYYFLFKNKKSKL